MSRLAITLGDPAGIGPEIVLKAALRLRERSDIELVVVGPESYLASTAQAIGGEVLAAWQGGERTRGFRIEEIATASSPIQIGVVSPEAGAVAFHSIKRAVELTMSKQTDAIVTPPINKEAINLAGFHYSGHTEMLADLSGGSDPVMLLLHGDMRVSHVSTHIPLEQVPSRVTPPRLRRVITLTHEALVNLGIKRRRIAVAALNPHAGEGGVLGRQDIDIIQPVVRTMAAEGINVEGPEAGDTVFVKLHAGYYDAVVAMYHDQGHIPVKLIGLHVNSTTGAWNLSGINITLGLPVLRTSVDHGTAFDIAAKYIASEQSLIEAVEHAHTMANFPKRVPEPAGQETA